MSFVQDLIATTAKFANFAQCLMWLGVVSASSSGVSAFGTIHSTTRVPDAFGEIVDVVRVKRRAGLEVM